MKLPVGIEPAPEGGSGFIVTIRGRKYPMSEAKAREYLRSVIKYGVEFALRRLPR